MHERFTDRARLVMERANQEATRQGQGYIGTEHVLFGIIQQGDCAAMNVLVRLGVDTSALCTQLEELIGTGGPPLPKMKAVLDTAIAESHSLGHWYVGTEHLLLGILSEPENPAGSVLRGRGLQLVVVRQAVIDLLQGVQDQSSE